MLACGPVLMALFYEAALLPSSNFVEVHSCQIAMHQACFTQSVDLMKNIKASRFSLPLAHYDWWVQHSAGADPVGTAEW